MIYLDYNATTPIASDVCEAMLPFHTEHFGNPSSGHALGQRTAAAIAQARAQVASLLGCDEDEIVFTGGGTESNNMALQGALFRDAEKRGSKGHLIISAIEHPAITEPAKYLESLGFAVSIVGCDAQGVVNPTDVEAALRDDTVLVSVMHANNEVGTIQPIAEIARICRERGVLCHTDAAQAVGKIATRVDDLGVDLLTIAGHKVYAPKGVGALYIRRGVELEPVLHGAGHEQGRRPGTENVPYIVGLGAAADRIREKGADAAAQMAGLRDRLALALQQSIDPTPTINGAGAERLPNTLSINFPGVNGAELLAKCDDVCASTGAACHSGASSLSATLRAMGLDESVARGTVRLSVGWSTTADEIDRAAQQLIAAYRSFA